MRRLVPVFAACALLAALPGIAVAQSAGDDQYVDPLNGLTGGGSGGGGGSGTGAGGSGTGTGTGVGSAGAGVAGSAEADVDGLPSELARTGAELPVIAAAGLLLLAGGIALRRLPGERR